MPYKYLFFLLWALCPEQAIPNLQKTASSIKPQFCNNSTTIIKRFCVFLRNKRILHFMGVSKKRYRDVKFSGSGSSTFILGEIWKSSLFFFFPPGVRVKIQHL